MALYPIKGSGKGSCCFYEEKEAVYENGFVLGLELGSEQKRDKQKNIGKQDLQDVRIMVVDDNNASLRVLSEFLQKRGATVSYKENAEIAMQEYMDSPLDYYDMILLGPRNHLRIDHPAS